MRSHTKVVFSVILAMAGLGLMVVGAFVFSHVFPIHRGLNPFVVMKEFALTVFLISSGAHFFNLGTTNMLEGMEEAESGAKDPSIKLV